MEVTKAKYALDAAGSCIAPCFKNLTTGMVSESESECMTNCVAKSMETLSLLQLHMGQTMKSWICSIINHEKIDVYLII